MQLRALGREKVTRRTKGAGKERLAKEVGGGGVWNCGADIAGTRGRLVLDSTVSPRTEYFVVEESSSKLWI